mmetsp:Transcript_10797/g.8047  ORF Transcript_10797/g.8047 Transcript_10797/m.8047 type:complete len:86 (+) Transcript_10797:837-1094(+)
MMRSNDQGQIERFSTLDGTLGDPIGGLCTFRIQKNHIFLYKNEFHSGFNAFGIEFKSMNKFQMYYYFVKTFKRAIDSYVQHPVFE